MGSWGVSLVKLFQVGGPGFEPSVRELRKQADAIDAWPPASEPRPCGLHSVMSC